MDLRRLRYFVALAEELHFGRAARRLHVVQPALSQQLRALEEEIGAALVERTTRSVKLTAAGATLLGQARRVLADVEHAVLSTQRAARGATGHLAIGFVSAAALRVLPATLSAFRAEQPGVQIAVHEMGTAEQLRALEEERIDVGFVLPPADAGKLAMETVYDEPLVAVLPVGHRLAKRKTVTLASLAGEDVVWMQRGSEPRLYERYLQVCLQAGYVPRIAYEVERLESMLALVAAGLGVSHAPASTGRTPRRGVVCVPMVRPRLRAGVGVAYSRENRSPSLAPFLAIARRIGRSRGAAPVARVAAG